MADPVTSLLLWLALWCILLFVIGTLRGKVLENQALKIVMAPGLLFEALLRMAVCLVTTTPIKSLRPFAHRKPYLATGLCDARPPILVLATGLRLTLLYVVVYYTLLSFPAFLESAFALPTLEDGDTLVETSSLQRFQVGVGELTRTLSLGSFWGFFLVYTLFTALIASGLSNREFSAAMALWFLLVGGAWGIDWLGLRFSWFSNGWFISWLYSDEFFAAFSLVVFLSLTAVLFLCLRRTLGEVLLAANRDPAGKKGGAKKQ